MQEFRPNKKQELQERILLDYLKNIASSYSPFSSVLEEDNPLNFAVSDIQSLESNTRYDLVISCEVLLHVLPSEIENVMIKLVKMSNKHIINIDWYEKKTPRNAAPHNFIHQYEKIYKNIPTVSNIYRTRIVTRESWLRSLDTKQSIFHACK
jgi:2-polyprenyl-3-methyl-5-hydroxy-6-metoxy-1,4-benzoquinol methylase